MANNGTSITSPPFIPMFNGEKYEFWSIKMMTLFKSQELWEFVENGYEKEEKDEQKLKEAKKKDAKALFFLQQSVSDSLFPRIASAATSKEAWQSLKTEFQGSTKDIAKISVKPVVISTAGESKTESDPSVKPQGGDRSERAELGVAGEPSTCTITQHSTYLIDIIHPNDNKVKGSFSSVLFHV
nr:Retrovirus-related Pol polyprotein from transposon TNT 1-94 [Ipomoea batatas]